MNEDFHYYGTYVAALLAGFDHEESLEICYSAQFVDTCSKTLLSKIHGPLNAATTQLQFEIADTRPDIIGLQDITRIWSSFHFLPKDLYAQKAKRTKRFMHKYRLICGPNGELVKATVENAKDKSLQSIGIAMHVLADTWAHSGFAGTPSLCMNNTNNYFYEIFGDENAEVEIPVKFRHSPSAPDDIDKHIYSNSIYQGRENSIMNLGHGRAGHLPDYSFVKYKYLPSWGDYEVIVKDNQSDYYKAFTQMIYAMRYLRGEIPEFTLETYDSEKIVSCADQLKEIFKKRQLSDSEDLKRLGESISGKEIEPFDIDKYQRQYILAPRDKKECTFLGKFITGALSQKGMVTSAIYRSGNRLAGFSREIKLYEVKK